MKVAIYVRVSTLEQVKSGYSIQEQQDRLEAYCKSRDWEIYKTYVDPGFSGADLERPGIRQMVNDGIDKKYNTVLVYKLDRLSRSQKDTLLLIEEVFNKNDISFVSLSENFDTSTSFGRAMIGMLSVFAQLERENIRERLEMGRVARAKEGYYHGGGNYEPLGYTYIDGELVVNEDERGIVEDIFILPAHAGVSLT